MAYDNQSAVISLSADGELVPAVAGKRIVVLGYVIVNNVATAQTVSFQSASTDITGIMGLPSSIGGGISAHAAHGRCLFKTNKGEALNLNVSAATAVAGHVYYMYV
jgi:hypothetical protein